MQKAIREHHNLGCYGRGTWRVRAVGECDFTSSGALIGLRSTDNDEEALVDELEVVEVEGDEL